MSIKSFKFFPDIGLCYQPYGKTGNTAFLNSILTVLKSNGASFEGGKTVHQSLNNTAHQIVCNFGDENHGYIFKNTDNKFVITVRNPYSRVLSLYLHVTKGGDNGGLSDYWSRRLNCFRDVVSFEEFLELLAKVGVDNIDGHTYSFSKTSLIGKASYDCVVRFENFENDISSFLFDCFGHKFRVSHKGAKTSASKKIDEYYDSRCVEIVKDIYGEDFALLGYSPNITDVGMLPVLPRCEMKISEYYVLNR